MVMRIYALLLCVACACSFNDREFSDRRCTSDQDCSRPDQSCVDNTCTQKGCTEPAQCGSDYQYACTSGACVARACRDTTDCELGYGCNAGFCQASFNVASAMSTTSRSITVTFDGPPDAAAATSLASYAVSGLTLSGTPSLSGSTVTLTTSTQTETSYTVTVTGVTRDDDNAPLTTATASFTGRAVFDVASATATSSNSVLVTFTAPPDPATAGALANYSIAGLTLSGTPTVTGSGVRLQTSPQSATPYTVTVAGVRRANDSEPLTVTAANFVGRIDFNVASAVATSSHTIDVTFDAPPNTAQATTLANYSVPGLALSGVPVLSGNTVTISTAAQTATTYTVTVSGVTRANDGEALTVTATSFTGITSFNVTTAVPINTATVTVTFDAPPDPIAAMALEHYSIPGLTLGGTPMLTGNTVTLTTSAQAAQSYTVSVAGVTRASDGEPLTTASTSFTGRAPFDVVNAVATSTTQVQITFDAAPSVAQATTLSNYSIPGLTLNGTPSVAGNTVTLTTSPQAVTTFTVTVMGVTRAVDTEPLTGTTATFTGRAPFNVTSATALTSTSISVTFDAPPNAGQATTLGNYSVAGLTLTGAPLLAGNTVTLTTAPQTAQTYAIVVSNVRRASDAETLTVANTSFVGRPPFSIASAASASNVSMTVTFSAPPNPAQAATLASYSVPGLTLSGTPSLSGNTVTIVTSAQSVQSYTATVSGVTRAIDAEALTVVSASFTGRTGFNVTSAASVNTTSMSVTYDAPPNPAQATTLSNYAVPGLTLSGTPVLAGNSVIITTSAQSAQSYTVTSTGVTRASDASPLAVNMASFTHVSFNVASAASATSRTMTVTFDAPPNIAEAMTLANYSVPGLTLTGTPTVNGSTVTIMTSSQAAITYTVSVNNITRASDGTVLTTKNAQFTGRTPFNVLSAVSTSAGTVAVTFSDPPTAGQATSLANYTIPGLTLSGTPVLSGNVVTLTTSAQAATAYTVTVADVTRASDNETLTTNNASFTGTALAAPTITSVVVQATSPNNGTTFYNTGTATIVITGTNFINVSCPTGVALDDLNGAGVAVNTQSIACTVNSQTQITATYPAGIRTAGSLGWNVRVTNNIGTSTNAGASGKLVLKAGLLVSEVLVGLGGGNSEQEFIEIYNPTGSAIDMTALGVAVHMRSSGGTDTNLALTFLDGAGLRIVPSHGFFLIASASSSASNSWFAKRDATYNDSLGQLAGDGGVYLSLSASAQGKVLDKAGWGAQPASGREGNPIANIGNTASAQRKPSGGNGHATDTDDNFTDFLAPSTTITPHGNADAPEP